MRKIALVIVVLVTFQSNSLFAQDFKKPSEGKAVVYFLRTTGLGAAINFKFFDNENYLGKFSGKNYAMYEVEPGKHLFFAKSENVDFMEADLKPNGIYLIHVKPKMGGFKAAVRLEPITEEKELEKAKKLVSKKKPVEFNMKKKDEEQAKISEYMTKYEKRKGTDKVKILSPDMDYKQ